MVTSVFLVIVAYVVQQHVVEGFGSLWHEVTLRHFEPPCDCLISFANPCVPMPNMCSQHMCILVFCSTPFQIQILEAQDPFTQL